MTRLTIRSLVALLLIFASFFPEVLLAQQEDPLPTEFFGGVEPKPLNMEEVKRMIGYPPIAREAGIRGKVVVRVLVDQQGQYVKHEVIKDPHPILTNAVTSKLHFISWTQGKMDGEPVKVWVTIPFQFTLSGDPVIPVQYKVTGVEVSLLEGSVKRTRKEISDPIWKEQEEAIELWNADIRLKGTEPAGGTASCSFKVNKKAEVEGYIVWHSSYMLTGSAKAYLKQCIESGTWVPAKVGKKYIDSEVLLTLQLKEK
jgi:hypothetical protein